MTEVYVGSGREGDADESTKRVDHGGPSLPPASKRQRLGTPALLTPTPCQQQPLPLHEERCCICTERSTCRTRRCVCFTARKFCTSCVCFDKCSNKGGLKSAPCALHSTAPETDGSVAPAVALAPASPPPAVIWTQTPDNPSDDATRDGPVEVAESENPADPNGPDQPIGSVQEKVGDLPGATISEADLLMDKV